MAEIEKNNKYLDLSGLEYFKNNYIQNIYSFSLPQNNITEEANKQLKITGNITITSSNSNKTTYTMAEAKRGDILYANAKKTAYIVTGFGTSGNEDTRTHVLLTPIAGGGLDSAVWDESENKIIFTLTDGTTKDVIIEDIATLERDLGDLMDRAVTTEQNLAPNKIIIGNNNHVVVASDYTVADIVNIAKGKTKSYVISTELETIEGFINGNISFKTNDDTLTIDKTLPEGTTKLQDNAGNIINLSDLKVGDLILILEADYPDRWVSEVSSNFVAFTIVETEKIDLTPYLKKPTGQSPVSDEAILTYSSSLDRTAILYTIAKDNWTSGSNSKIPTTAQVINWATGTFDSPAEVTNKITTALASYLTAEDAKNTYVPIYTPINSSATTNIIVQPNVNPLFTYDDLTLGIGSNAVLYNTGIKIMQPHEATETGEITFKAVDFNTHFRQIHLSGTSFYSTYDSLLGKAYEILDTSMKIENSDIDTMFGVISA